MLSPFPLPRCLVLALGVVISGCIVVPVTTTSYDRECRVVTRRMELEAVQLAYLGSCHQTDCGALLATIGITAVGSTVISGSIAIVGNVVYWLEKQGQCMKLDSPVPSFTDKKTAATE